MTPEQTSFGDRARKPSTRGESAELVLAGIERKHQDPETHALPDSEQVPHETEPHAHTPLKPVRVFQEPRMDSEGNPLVLCRFCGDSVVRVIDDKYNTPIFVEWVPGKRGKFLVRNGRASFWGPRGGNYRKHACRTGTHQDQAAV